MVCSELGKDCGGGGGGAGALVGVKFPVTEGLPAEGKGPLAFLYSFPSVVLIWASGCGGRGGTPDTLHAQQC